MHEEERRETKRGKIQHQSQTNGGYKGEERRGEREEQGRREIGKKEKEKKAERGNISC